MFSVEPEMLRRLLLPGLLVSLTLSATNELNAVVPGQDSESPADRAPVVIMAPKGPVLVDLRLSVDGESYRVWVTEYLASKTDVDGDGRLTEAELNLIPARLLQQAGLGSGKRALQKATGMKDAVSIPLRRFTPWFAGELGQSFNVIAGAVNASEAVRLASLLDSNSDGNVSREELRNSGYSMRFRDLDDDQTFSASELLPYRDPRNQQAAVVPDAADLPFVQLVDEDAIQRTAAKIVARYGAAESVSVATFRLTDDAASTLPQEMSVSDCESFLKQPVYHMVMHVLLSDKPNRSQVRFDVPQTSTSFCRVESSPRGRTKLIIDDMPVQVRARGGGMKTRTFLTSIVMQYFSVQDADKNGYLSEEEFQGIQSRMAQNGMPATFADADLNSDEMLFRDELRMFIERDAIATQSRIEVSVRQDGKTLFKILDANMDRRLSQRELLEGFDALLEFDINSDDKVSEAELGTAYALEIGLGQAEALRMDSMMQNSNMGMASTDAVLPGVTGLEGPEWFRRMDRNQDGDVSLREFLGPHDIFDRTDTNHDGLLTAAEAEVLK